MRKHHLSTVKPRVSNVKPRVEYVQWTFDGRVDRTYEAPGDWRDLNEIYCSDHRSGQVHSLQIVFFHQRYDVPFNGTMLIAQAPGDGGARINYMVSTTPDPSLPEGADYLSADGELTVSIKYENGVGRTDGRFNGSFRAKGSPRPHTVEGRFTVLWPYP